MSSHTVELHCEMSETCTQEVTHVDQDGYTYCTSHGVARRSYKPCRKLRTAELNKLQRGETIERY